MRTALAELILPQASPLNGEPYDRIDAERLAGVLKAPMSALARTVDALRIKLEENGDAAPAAAAEAPAAEEAPAAADAAPAEAAEVAAPEER